MRRSLLAYVATAIAFCALDFIWLSTVAPSFYQQQVGALLLAAPRPLPALAFYLLYVAGLVVFCVLPAVDASSWRKAALLGSLFGLVAYATYDLSNLATLKGWTDPVALVDMLWGAVASMLASTSGYAGTRFFGSHSR